MLIYITSGIEILGVVIAAVVSMIVGMMWYSPSLFGTKWMELVGITKEKPAYRMNSAWASYLVTFLSSLVMAYTLGLFIKNMFVPSSIQAILVGIIAWLGFIATSNSSEYLFNSQKKPWALYVLNMGYYLVNLIVSSAILFIFLK